MTFIGTQSFSDCSSLTSIGIPKSVTYIGDGAFYNCSGLTSITINSVPIIGDSAFSGCSCLTSITIIDNITRNKSNHKSCRSLKDIYCYNFSKVWSNAFNKSLVGNITLYIPKHELGLNGFFIPTTCRNRNICVLSGFKEILPIEAKVENIELPETIVLTENSVHTLNLTITPNYATDQHLKWNSSNEEVAVVNSKGRVVALSSGTATITATATDGSEVCTSCKIVVRRMVKNIQLSQTSVKLVAGNSHLLNVIVTPKDAYDTSLTWSTTDDDIAMVLGNGRIVAVSVGTATITAKANDGSESASKCEVVVSE